MNERFLADTVIPDGLYFGKTLALGITCYD